MEIDPPKNVNHEFLKDLEKENCFSRRSFAKWERINHSWSYPKRNLLIAI